MGDEAPDYWLTGKLFCELCGALMELIESEVSG